MDDGWINHQYQSDVVYFYNQLMEFEWFKNLNSDRQIILIDMAFMGLKKFLGFKKMIKAVSERDFAQVSFEMLS